MRFKMFLNELLDKIIKQNSLFLVVLLVNLIFVLYMGYTKAAFYMDETWSFQISSGYNDDYKYDNWNLVDDFMKTMLPQNGEKYSISTVITGIQNYGEPHPFLWQFLLNVVNSLYTNVSGKGYISKWPGLILNCFIFVFIYITMYVISKRIFSNKFVALLPNILWGFGLNGINNVIFIRMYLLTTLWQCLLYYCIYKFVEYKHIKIRHYIFLSIIGLAGMLTLYSFVPVYIITSFIVLVYLLVQDKGRIVLGLGLTIGVTVGVFFAIVLHFFDKMIFYGGGHSKEVLANILQNPFQAISIIIDFFKEINKLLLGGIGQHILFMILVLTILNTINLILKMKKTNILGYLDNNFWYLIVLICGIFFSFSATALMIPGAYDRYTFQFAPIFSIVLIGMVERVMFNGIVKVSKVSHRIVVGCLYAMIIFILFISWSNLKDDYTLLRYHMSYQIPNIAKIDELENPSCVYVYDQMEKWKIVMNMSYLTRMDKTYFVEKNQLENIIDLGLLNRLEGEKVVIYLENYELYDKVKQLFGDNIYLDGLFAEVSIGSEAKFYEFK